jgi:chaperone required for assembly of F1-ATPase
MKRFYKEAKAEKSGNGFAVLLDGKSVKTPAGQPLILPTQALAEAIAAEWQSQGEAIIPHSMPLMQLAATSIDHVPEKRPAMHDRLLAYVETELLCLRTDNPPELARLQEAEWQPPLDWLKQTHGIELKTGSGLTGPCQPAAASEAVARKLKALSPWAFMGVHEAASCSGSLVLAFALQEKAIDAGRAFELAELESLFQAKRWGLDAASENRHNNIRAELASLAKWFELV